MLVPENHEVTAWPHHKSRKMLRSESVSIGARRLNRGDIEWPLENRLPKPTCNTPLHEMLKIVLPGNPAHEPTNNQQRHLAAEDSTILKVQKTRYSLYKLTGQSPNLLFHRARRHRNLNKSRRY